MSGSDKDKDKEKVGYKKPPIHSRFQPGESGNPKGRPKKAETVGFELVAELNRKVKVRENGVEQTTSKAVALAKSLVGKALAGDMRAIGHLIRLLPTQFQAPPDVDPGVDNAIGDADAAALERFVQRRFAMMSRGGEQANSDNQVEALGAKKDENHDRP